MSEPIGRRSDEEMWRIVREGTWQQREKETADKILFPIDEAATRAGSYTLAGWLRMRKVLMFFPDLAAKILDMNSASMRGVQESLKKFEKH